MEDQFPMRDPSKLPVTCSGCFEPITKHGLYPTLLNKANKVDKVFHNLECLLLWAKRVGAKITIEITPPKENKNKH